jgi:hypothetical protein
MVESSMAIDAAIGAMPDFRAVSIASPYRAAKSPARVDGVGGITGFDIDG